MNGHADVLRWSVQHARLAPSVHNTQPWRFGVTGDVLTLRADLTRRLEVLDPAGRELVVSCGAALANVDLALRVAGLLPELDLAPDGRLLHRLADVRVAGEHATTGLERLLFRAMPSRATNRHALDGSAVSPELLSGLLRVAEDSGVEVVFVEDEQAYEEFRVLARLAGHAQEASPRQREELRRWARPGDDAADGIPFFARGLGAAGPRRLALPVRDFDVDGRAARHAQRPDATYDRPLLAVIATPGDGPRDSLRAGMALQRLLLAVTSAGLAASFVNQPVDDPALRPRAGAVAGVSGRVQVALRVGAGVPVRPVPRRPVEDLLDA
jgi:nitroreductase